MSPYECLYGTDLQDEEKSRDLLKEPSVARVLNAYGQNLALSTPKRVASLEARNEAAFWQGEFGRLWVQRIYVFGHPEDRHSVRPFWGFFHLRDEQVLRKLKEVFKGNVPAVAECYLTLPKLLRDAGYRVIEGPYTAFYGVLPLDVTPLVFPHRLLAGHCAQSAAHTALMLMSSRGARPLGLFDLNLIASAADQVPDVLVKNEGLTLDQIARVLRAKETGITALQDLSDNNWTAADLISLLRDCVLSELPLILAVDFKKWVQGVRKYQEINLPVIENSWHAVVLVGYRESDRHGTHFLFHDSFLGPWIQMDVDGLIHATRTTRRSNRTASSLCHMVIPAPRGVTQPITKVTQAACMTFHGNGCEHCRPAHLKRRLLSREEFIRLYAPHLLTRKRNQSDFVTDLHLRYPENDLQYIWQVVHIKTPEMTLFYNGGSSSLFAALEDSRFVLYNPDRDEVVGTWQFTQMGLM